MKNTISRRKKTLAGALSAAILIGASAYFFGAPVYAAITNILATGTIAYSEAIDGPATMTVRTLSFAPGEVGVWHYHPGPLFNVVTQGTVTVEDGCGGETSYGPGQGFEEGGRVHRPKNLGSEPTFAYQTFITPLGNPTTINIPNNEHLCGPPRAKDDCKRGGWMNFTFPHTFVNQGDCINYVNNGDVPLIGQQPR